MSTRDDLVSAAAGLLEADGLDAVTLRAVGDRAGVSRTAPYRHFDGKEGLLAAVAAADLRALRVALDHVAEADPDPYRLMFGARLRGAKTPELTKAAESTHDAFVAVVASAFPDADANPLAA